jgi:hypothetical protein
LGARVGVDGARLGAEDVGDVLGALVGTEIVGIVVGAEVGIDWKMGVSEKNTVRDFNQVQANRGNRVQTFSHGRGRP